MFATNIAVHKNKELKVGIKEVQFKNDFYMIDGKMYAPLRELSEKLGIPINWNEEKEQVELMV